jgi:hypothetical protein
MDGRKSDSTIGASGDGLNNFNDGKVSQNSVHRKVQDLISDMTS